MTKAVWKEAYSEKVLGTAQLSHARRLSMRSRRCVPRVDQAVTPSVPRPPKALLPYPPPRDSVRFSVCRVAAEILRILGQAPLNGQTPAQVSKQNLGRISRQCCLELSQLIVFDTAAVNSQTGSGRGLHYAFRAMVLQDLARHMPTGAVTGAEFLAMPHCRTKM